MIDLYPTNELYSVILEKKFNGEELTDYEKSKEDYFIQHANENAIEIASRIKNLEAEQKALLDAIKILEKKDFLIEDRKEKLKFELKRLLDIHDIKKIKTPFFDISISLNTPGTYISDESLIPEEYIKETILKRIDRSKILKDLKQGVLIPGAELEQKTRVEIK